MKNRIVLITGGASGIGKAMVRKFADRGCQVIIFDIVIKNIIVVCHVYPFEVILLDIVKLSLIIYLFYQA